MADLDLRTDYKDDILDSSVNEKRKYNIIDNADGTKSLEDVSEYTQRGDSFGAVDINKTNQAVLDLNQSLTDVEDKLITYVDITIDSRAYALNTRYSAIIKDKIPSGYIPVSVASLEAEGYTVRFIPWLHIDNVADYGVILYVYCTEACTTALTYRVYLQKAQ